MPSNMPTLPVIVLRRWAGGNMEPGDKARLPSSQALKLAAVGAVKVLSPVQRPASVEAVPAQMDVRTPEDKMAEQAEPMALVERAQESVAPIAAEPQHSRRRRK